MTQRRSIATAALPEAALLKNPVVARPTLKQSMAKHPLFPNMASGDCFCRSGWLNAPDKKRSTTDIFTANQGDEDCNHQEYKAVFRMVSEALP